MMLLVSSIESDRVNMDILLLTFRSEYNDATLVGLSAVKYLYYSVGG